MGARDRRTPAQSSAARDRAVRSQVQDVVGPFSPLWRDRLRALGRTAAEVVSAPALATLTAVGERDLCPGGDTGGAAGLVLQADGGAPGLVSAGPAPRGGLLARRPASARPASLAWTGLGVRFPVASTRADLDLITRAGERAWSVLGLTDADVLVGGLPTAPTTELQALRLAALGAGAPAVFPGQECLAVLEALRLLPATVLALPTGTAVRQLHELGAAGAPLGGLSLLVLVGAPDEGERSRVEQALASAGGGTADVAAVHVPSGHRLLWAECRPSVRGGRGAGLHTLPDLELVQLVDPETGTDAPGPGPREPALTQLGLRGSALLRWRTGDLVEGVEDGPCPACGRSVPRVTGLRRRALVPALALRSGTRAIDLRAVAAALGGSTDVEDWSAVVRTGPRGDEQLLVHVALPWTSDPADAAVSVVRDVRTACGALPSQVVLGRAGELPRGDVRLSAHLSTG